jgi:hypothetical protein
MFNIFKSIRASHAIAAGGATYIGYYSLWLQLKDRKNSQAFSVLENKLNENLNVNAVLSRELDQMKTENAQMNEEKLQILTFFKDQMGETSRQIIEIKNKLEGLKASFKNSTSVNQDDVINTLEKLVEQINVSNSTAKKALELWNNSFNKFLGQNSLNNLFDQFKELINQLNFEQLWALSHIFASVFLLLLVINIIIIIYSDFFINNLKIEERYPRLSRLLKIRRVTQQYSLIFNILIIIITLIATIFINYAILVN